MKPSEFLRHLDQTATPKPWTMYHDTCASCRKENRAEYNISGPPGGWHAQFSHKPDPEMIVVLRNVLPEIIAVIHKAESRLSARTELRVLTEAIDREVNRESNGTP